MSKLVLTFALKVIVLTSAVVLLIGGNLNVDWHSDFVGPAYSQGVGASGCVALCGGGGGGSGGGGGGGRGGSTTPAQTANTLVRFGSQALDNEDFARAVAMFQEALNFNSELDVARSFLAGSLGVM